MDTVRFLLGEKKEVRIKVISTKGDTFTISTASAQLQDLMGNDVGSVLPATVAGKDIFVLLEPAARGNYSLVFTYEVTIERLKAAIPIEVK